MRDQRQYYTLVSSLPPIPDFEHADRLPITEARLTERLSMLEADDLEIVEFAKSVIAWKEHPMERTDAEVVTLFERIITSLASRASPVRQMIEFRISVRTITAALRRRQLGHPAPKPGEPWGVGSWMRQIERHWDEPDFKLKAAFPWIPQVRQFLVDCEPLALQRLLLSVTWERMELLTRGSMFGFEVVLAYLFKWDILQRWLSYNRKEAQTRFDTLVTEVIGEHDQFFN